jgi:hypothetical protein
VKDDYTKQNDQLTKKLESKSLIWLLFEYSIIFESFSNRPCFGSQNQMSSLMP